MAFRKRKFSAGDESGDMPLQITSMADIFTIILVFLLKSFSTSLATLAPSQGLQLPMVSAPSKEQIRDALKVEILANAILIDQKPVTQLYSFRFPNNNQLPDGTVSPVSEAVVQTLLRERAKTSRRPASDSSFLILLADAKTPYRTLKTVLSSAASAGFVDLQLIVVGGE